MTNTPSSLFLVSCVAGKLPGPVPARELYTSDWFIKACSYVARQGQPWFILSAKHGLIHPDEVISEYDLTLKTMKKADRRKWAKVVSSQLRPHLVGINDIVFLAGERYREFLKPELIDKGLSVSVPMRGLKIGEQLRWLKQEYKKYAGNTYS